MPGCGWSHKQWDGTGDDLPGWSRNQLTITGAPELLDKLAAVVAGTTGDGEASPLSLEAILPTPPELLNDDPTDERWNIWRMLNWTVRWDLRDPATLERNPGKLTYRFVTAWSGPTGVVNVLSRRFPELNFRLVFAEPGVNAAAAVRFVDGESVSSDWEHAWEERSGALDILSRNWPDEARRWREESAEQDRSKPIPV